MKDLKLNNKKIMALLTSGMMTLSFAGCNENEKKENDVSSTSIVDQQKETLATESVSETTVTSVPVETSIAVDTSVCTYDAQTDKSFKDVSNEHNAVYQEGYYNIYLEGNADINIYGQCDQDKINIIQEETTQKTEVTTEAVTTEAPVVTTIPVTTEAPVVTTVPVTTEAPVVTTVPVTTEAPVVTTVPVTTKAPVVTTTNVTTEAPVYNQYQEIDLARFEELTDALLKELNAHKVVKSAGKQFTKADLYSTVYIYNIDFIDEDLKRQLVEKNYIADDIATILVDAASVRDAVSTYNQNLLIYNSNMDELIFAFDYFKDDSYVYSELIDDEGVYRTFDYNSLNMVSTRITEKLKKVDIDTYFAARDEFYANHDSINMPYAKYASACDEKPKMFEGVSSFQMADFVDISVAVNDIEAKNNVYNSLKLSVDASLNNDQAYAVINNYYNFCIANKTATTLTDCGAGATFAINTNILAYTRFIGYNEYKTMQGFAENEHDYKQIKVKYKTIEEVIQELNDVVRIYENCSKQLTK